MRGDLKKKITAEGNQMYVREIHRGFSMYLQENRQIMVRQFVYRVRVVQTQYKIVFKKFKSFKNMYQVFIF